MSSSRRACRPPTVIRRANPAGVYRALETLPDEDDRTRGFRDAALRLDGDRELHGSLAEVLLRGNGDDGRAAFARVERAGGDGLVAHERPQFDAAFARVERAGGDGLVAHERPQFVALLERQRREAAD